MSENFSNQSLAKLEKGYTLTGADQERIKNIIQQIITGKEISNVLENLKINSLDEDTGKSLNIRDKNDYSFKNILVDRVFDIFNGQTSRGHMGFVKTDQEVRKKAVKKFIRQEIFKAWEANKKD